MRGIRWQNESQKHIVILSYQKGQKKRGKEGSWTADFSLAALPRRIRQAPISGTFPPLFFPFLSFYLRFATRTKPAAPSLLIHSMIVSAPDASHNVRTCTPWSPSLLQLLGHRRLLREDLRVHHLLRCRAVHALRIGPLVWPHKLANCLANGWIILSSFGPAWVSALAFTSRKAVLSTSGMGAWPRKDGSGGFVHRMPGATPRASAAGHSFPVCPSGPPACRGCADAACTSASAQSARVSGARSS